MRCLEPTLVETLPVLSEVLPTPLRSKLYIAKLLKQALSQPHHFVH